MNVNDFAEIRGRKLEYKSHVSGEELGYARPQTDTFGVLYPKDYDETKTYPLCVVFHSAGHTVYNIFTCLLSEGDHDVYHVPEDMFGLFPDCLAHAWDEGSTDWWWGGRNAQEPEPNGRSGVELRPVEKRIYATIGWMTDNFKIDPNRIYGVGNSMGGSGALGLGLSRGDLFAALKVNVAAGVYHAIDRCALEADALDGFSIPDPPVVLDYSAQNDTWSSGHEHLYRAMRENGFALMGFWGPFGHENNHSKIAEYNDIVQAFDIYSIRKNEAYPAFTNSTSDDRNPWEDPARGAVSGQVNGYYRWRVLSDTENEFSIELRMLRQDEWESRLDFPTESTADVTLRRLQNFKVSDGDCLTYSFGDKEGSVTVSGALKLEGLHITDKPTLLKIRK